MSEKKGPPHGGKPFGEGNKPRGRPKGRQNDATIEARQAARSIVDDPLYREQLKNRALSGDLPPAVEVMLHHYAHGRPVERHEMTGADGGPLRVESAVHVYLPDNGRGGK